METQALMHRETDTNLRMGLHRGQAEIWKGGSLRLAPQGCCLVVWAGGDCAVGRGSSCSLSLEELQDGLDI